MVILNFEIFQNEYMSGFVETWDKDSNEKTYIKIDVWLEATYQPSATAGSRCLAFLRRQHASFDTDSYYFWCDFLGNNVY